MPQRRQREAERQRVAAERKAARESGVMMQVSGGKAGAAGAPPEGVAAPATAIAAEASSRLALDPERDPNSQQRKADFLAGKDGGGDSNPHALAPAPSPWTLSAGSVIAASLITGLNSDLPGLVTGAGDRERL